MRLVWRHRIRFLLVFLPIFIIGFGVLLLTPERYTAHATLMVGVRQPELVTTEQLREPLRAEPDMDGAIELMRSQSVLRHVVETLALDRRPEFAAAARGREGSFLERLRRRLAELLGRDYRGVQQHVQDDLVGAVVARLRRELKIDRIGRSNLLDAGYSSGDPNLAAGVVNALATVSAADEDFLARMTLAERSGFQLAKTSVVSLAVPPVEPSSPNILLIIAGTLFCAVSAALSAVLWKEHRVQQTVLSTEELARRGLRPLALIVSHRNSLRARGPRSSMLTSSLDAAFINSVTSLQASLSTLPAVHGPGCRVFLFTSALRSEGKSTTTAALAVSMAMSGSRVLLIDADLRSPTLHRIFRKDLSPGLSDVIRPGANLEGLIQSDPGTGVHLLAAGSHRERPLEVVGLGRLRHLIDTWRASYDVVLIDSPPVIAAGNTLVLAATADYAVLVARWRKTSWRALNQALRLLLESGAQIAGVAISRVNLKQLAGYD